MNLRLLPALLFLVVCASTSLAQTSNLIFFTDNGERFTIIMNGLRYNETPATNVKLTELSPAVYKVKAIFEDPALGEVTKTIPLESYREITFNIRLKKQSDVGKTFKRMGKQVGRDLNMVDSSEVYADPKETYVMRFISEYPIGTPPAQPQPVYNTQPAVVAGTPGTVQQTTTTTTTVRSTGVQPAGTSMNVSVNDPEMGVNFNMNVGTPTGTAVTSGGTVQQSTTTTTTYGTPVQNRTTSHYVMPGYNGAIGCPWPMDQSAFNNAVNTVKGQSFEDNKLQVARQVLMSNCMTSAQVAQVMKLFSFEDSRLDFAKFAYGYTYDLGNYFMVNQSFSFSSSVDELNAYIQGRR